MGKADLDLFWRYFNALTLLGMCSIHVPKELRELIEYVMDDACHHYPLTWRRVLDRVEIDVDRIKMARMDETAEKTT